MRLRVNDCVRITIGPFKGICGSIVSLCSHQRAVVRVDLRGRQVLIELDQDMLVENREPNSSTAREQV